MSLFLNFSNSFINNRSSCLWGRIHFSYVEDSFHFHDGKQCKCLRPLIRGSLLTAGLHCQQSKCIFQMQLFHLLEYSLNHHYTQSLEQTRLCAIAADLEWTRYRLLLMTWTVDAHLEQLWKMATTLYVSGASLLTVNKKVSKGTRGTCSGIISF